MAIHTDPAPAALPQTLDAPSAHDLASLTKGRKAFSTRVPGQQPIIDSSSLKDFQDCPRKYYYSMILGLATPKKSADLTFGSAYQAALEVYDLARARGTTHRAAQLAALHIALIEGAALQTAAEIAASDDDDDKSQKTRDNLVRAVVWHTDHYEHDPLRTYRLANGRAAVELSFRLPTDYSLHEGEGVELSGHMDRVVTSGGDADAPLYILDHKTTKSPISSFYQAQFSPDTQVSTYNFAGKVVLDRPCRGVIIDAAQILAHAVRFHRFIVQRSARQLEEWYSELGHWLGLMALCVLRRSWPQNPQSCYRCSFRRICATDPSMRKIVATNEYQRRFWDAAKPRGEDTTDAP